MPIRAVEELPGQGRGAMFDPEQNAILVKKGMDAPDILFPIRPKKVKTGKISAFPIFIKIIRSTIGPTHLFTPLQRLPNR